MTISTITEPAVFASERFLDVLRVEGRVTRDAMGDPIEPKDGLARYAEKVLELPLKVSSEVPDDEFWVQEADGSVSRHKYSGVDKLGQLTFQTLLPDEGKPATEEEG